MKTQFARRLVLFAAAVLGIAACPGKGPRKVAAIDIFSREANIDSVICFWKRGDSVTVCTRYPNAGRKDTSGLYE
jgi:hypothetical protein